MSQRKKGGKAWIQRHLSDPYVQAANKQGLRSRASFKLLQLQEKDKLFKPGMAVVDLGAAPGGWSQVVAKIVAPTGQVIAVDLLPMDPVGGVEYLQGDFLDSAIQTQITERLKAKAFDWILSDMAPNLSGHRAVDQPKAMALCEEVLYFADQYLAPGGGLLIKTFQGEGFEPYIKMLRERFEKVITRKPEASRKDSREVYLLAKMYKVV